MIGLQPLQTTLLPSSTSLPLTSGNTHLVVPMVSVRTKQPDKEMQRRGHLGAAAKKMRANVKRDSELPVDDNGDSSELFKEFNDLNHNFDDESQFGDDSHFQDETDSSDAHDSDDESHLMDGRDPLPLLPFGPTREIKRATGTVKTPKLAPAAAKAGKPAVTPQPRPTQTVMAAGKPAVTPQPRPTQTVMEAGKPAVTPSPKPTQTVIEARDSTKTAPDADAKTSTSRKSAPGKSTPQGTISQPSPQKTTPSHPLDQGSDSQTKKKPKPNPPEAITINYPAAPNPSKVPATLNVQDCVYKSEANSFLVKFHQTSEAQVQGYWTTFQGHVSQARKSIEREAFGSPLTQEDLNILDLKAASTLFPTLVNSAGELRTRAEKEQRSKGDLIGVLKEKQKTFQEISTAASKQASKIQDRIEGLEASAHTKKSTKAQKELEEELKSESSEKATLAAVIGTMPAPLSVMEAQRFSNTLADHITALAERYRQELSPLVVYIRRMATVLAGNEHRIMQLREYLATLINKQDETAKGYFFPKFMEVLAPGTHVCQCSECVANQKSMKATETATEAGGSNEIATKANLNALDIPAGSDYRDPSMVYRQPNLQLPDLSHHDLTPAMLEDLTYRYKESKYTFEQYNTLLNLAHEQYQSEIKALQDYGKLLDRKDEAKNKAQVANAVQVAIEESIKRDKELEEQRALDLQLAEEAKAQIKEFMQLEEQAFKTLATLPEKERNQLTLEERKVKINLKFGKDQEDLTWETRLQYAEDIQGAFLDHIVTDPKELDDIIQAHKASGNPEPTPLERKPVDTSQG